MAVSDVSYNDTPVKRVGNYEILGVIGRGSFSEVRKAKCLDTGDIVAVKQIGKQVFAEKSLVAQIQREVAILKNVKHRNVVHLVQVLRTTSNIYLIFEFVDGGDLGQLIQKYTRFSDDVSRQYFRQLIAGLAYVHKHGVAHRDLKLENILITSTGFLKISDFGLARAGAGTKSLGGLESHTADFVTRCGTPNFVAPEVLTEPTYNGFRADVWSCGVILFVMLSGRLPFRAQDIAELYNKIQTCDFKMSDFISDAAGDLIRRMLVVSPDRRASIHDIVNHPWFRLGISPEESAEIADILTVKPQLQTPLVNITPQSGTAVFPPVAPRVGQR